MKTVGTSEWTLNRTQMLKGPDRWCEDHGKVYQYYLSAYVHRNAILSGLQINTIWATRYFENPALLFQHEDPLVKCQKWNFQK